MPKKIVRPIPEKMSGQFDPAGPDILEELRVRGILRFSPNADPRDLYPTKRDNYTVGKYA